MVRSSAASVKESTLLALKTALKSCSTDAGKQIRPHFGEHAPVGKWRFLQKWRNSPGAATFSESMKSALLDKNFRMSQSRRSSTEGVKSIAMKSRRWKKDTVTTLFKDGLNWDKYLQICNLPAAPPECFKQTLGVLENRFQTGQKLEARDPRNPTSICLASVVSLQGPRILLRLDGGDKCNDFWRLVDSGDIYPLGTHEAKGVLLQPPLGYTRNVSTWASFLAKNRVKSDEVPQECFYQEPLSPDKIRFEIGMKLEAVDKKNADLICPATVGDVKGDQIFISFDGWRGAMDYWCDYTSRDLFPVGWCADNDHPLSSPGAKGDNPAVVARLKRIADESKRQTRSGGINQTEIDKPLAGKSYVEAQTKASDQTSPANLIRGRGKGRVTRSLTPVPKRIDDLVDVPSAIASDGTTGNEMPKDAIFTADSSCEEDTFDSSLSSSQQSSDSYSSGGEGRDEYNLSQTVVDTQDTVKSMESQSDGDDAEHEAECSKKDDSVTVKKSRVVEKGLEGTPKSDKKSHKKRKKGRKKMKKLSSKYADSPDEIYPERRRYASAGDEEYNRHRLKKRMKKKRKHSTSSLYDSSPRKRMLGFGTPSSPIPRNSPHQSSHMLSPSFLDHAKSPTSLFGFSRDEIVKKATEGWPSGLLGGSSMVVTSDNKLARFGSITHSNTSCQTQEVADAGSTTQHQSIEVVHGQVTTTTEIDERPDVVNSVGNSSSSQELRLPDLSTSNVKDMDIMHVSSQTVSSTTHPKSGNEPESPISNMEHKVPPPQTRRSRNPQRWSVVDVKNYVQEHEPALAQHVELFQIHEIDGQALLLLNSSIAVKYMNMKLGPALKLASLVERLKQLVPPS